VGHGKKKPPCACRVQAKNLPLTEGEEYKLKVEAPKKKEKPHPEFGG